MLRATTYCVWTAFATLATAVTAGHAAENQQPAEPGGLAEIVVTAQRRAENLQDVPITVVSLDADKMAASGVRFIQDLATIVPGFQGPGDNGVNSPHLRGIGNAVISPGNDAGVSYYVDGVYIPTTLTAPIPVNDVAQMEVLKGPQGTLFGRNATAGLIQITTRNPANTFEAEGEFGYGSYGAVAGFLYAGGPLSDRVAAGLSVNASHQDEGWGTNQLDGAEIGGFDLDLTIRNKWIVEMSSDTDLQVSVDYGRNRGFGMWTFRPYPANVSTLLGVFPEGDNPWDANLNSISQSETSVAGASARLTHEFGSVTLTSISGYRDSATDVIGLDSDGTPVPVLRLDSWQDAQQWTQELQLASSTDGPFEWTAGIYYLDGKDSFDGDVTVAGLGIIPITNDQRTESISGYGQGSYALTERSKLTLGGRFTSETRELIPRSLALARTDISEDVPTWRVALDHRITDAVMVYGSASRGFKSGGFNLTAAQDAPFDPEYLTAYEIGSKSMLLDERLRFNVAAFYYDYSGIQLTVLRNALETLYNAASAELYGVDVDFDALVTSRLSVSGGFEYLHSEYTEFPDAEIFTPLPGGGFAQSTGPATGNQLVQAPEFSVALAATYRIPTEHGNYELSGTYHYNDGYFTQPDNNLSQPSYDLVGASIRYTSVGEKFWIRAWGKNLGDEATTNLLSTTAITSYGMLNAPRTYGVTFGVAY